MPPPRGLRPTEKPTPEQRKQVRRKEQWQKEKEATSGKKETAMH